MPGVGVGLDVVLAVVDCDGTIFLHKREHTGASGTTVEPNDNWVGRRITFRFREYVVKCLGVSDIEVTTVHVGRKGGSVWEVGHFVGERSGYCSSGNECECES